MLLVFMLLLVPAGYAHSGRTDGSGGHRDNKNASGLGSYHYHCGGYSAHLHKNGNCPYSRSSVSSSNNQLSSSTTTVASASPKSSGLYAVVPNYAVNLSGHAVDNTKLQYPLLNYKNVTYIPMTYNNSKSLGLLTKQEGTILNIDKQDAGFTQDLAGECKVNEKKAVSKTNLIVYANGNLLVQESDYPFLMYNNIVYLPLTYNIGQALGIGITWDAVNGIQVGV